MNKKIFNLVILIFLVGALSLVTAEKNWAFENYTVNVSHDLFPFRDDLVSPDDFASPDDLASLNVIGNLTLKRWIGKIDVDRGLNGENVFY